MIFGIEYIGENIDKSTDIKLLKEWNFKGLSIKTIEGVIDDEYEDLIIKLSNDTTLEFEANLESGPGDSYYKDSGRRNPNFARLKVKHEDGKVLHNFEDVQNIFLETLANYGSIPFSILKVYEKIITFQINSINVLGFRGASLILTSLIEDYQFNPIHQDYSGFINTSIENHPNQKAFKFLVDNHEIFKPILNYFGYYIGENPTYDELILYKK